MALTFKPYSSTQLDMKCVQVLQVKMNKKSSLASSIIFLFIILTQLIQFNSTKRYDDVRDVTV